jgi:hypothetical protein
MNAATVRLPWAAATRAGVKLPENRGRPVAARHIGQPLAIHAAAPSGWSKPGALDPRLRRWWWGEDWASRPPLDPVDFGPLFRKVIAVATLTGCHQAVHRDGETCCPPFGDRYYRDDSKPAWHLTLGDVVALPEPVGPVKGQLSVPWTLPPEAAEQVAMQLVEAAR